MAVKWSVVLSVRFSQKIATKISIANDYFVGGPPPCLTELNEVELALLTPVKTFGYIFSSTGGKNMKLKEDLTYYKVKFESIAKYIMSLDVLGMHKNIVSVFYGKLTKACMIKLNRNQR